MCCWLWHASVISWICPLVVLFQRTSAYRCVLEVQVVLLSFSKRPAKPVPVTCGQRLIHNIWDISLWNVRIRQLKIRHESKHIYHGIAQHSLFQMLPISVVHVDNLLLKYLLHIKSCELLPLGEVVPLWICIQNPATRTDIFVFSEAGLSFLFQNMLSYDGLVWALTWTERSQ
jgi:hypothetical protein